MATIGEDYVSFETAKLLKEKGFDQSCATYYLKDKQVYAAPTQAMAMKWLREVHDIKIMICPCADGTYGYKTLNGFWHVNFDSYEDAVEAAIKYCLENLI